MVTGFLLLDEQNDGGHDGAIKGLPCAHEGNLEYR